MTTTPYTLHCYSDYTWQYIYATDDTDAMSQLKIWASTQKWEDIQIGAEVYYGLYRGHNRDNLIDDYTMITTQENTY